MVVVVMVWFGVVVVVMEWFGGVVVLTVVV